MTSQNSIIKPFKTPIFLLIGLTHFVVVKIVIIIIIIIIIIFIKGAQRQGGFQWGPHALI